MKRLRFAASLLVVATTLSACGAKSPEAATTESPIHPVASILDLMLGQVDPAADFLWESVATISTLEGTEELRPRTDEEWLALRMRALQLAEAANLLMTPGRRVAHEGQHLDDEGTPGNLTPEQAQVALDANHDLFIAYAAALRGTAVRTIEAIDKRDIDLYLEVGGQIDEACEQCHAKFWYPGAAPPPMAMR
ncbi:MAG: hypothetical protein ABW136_07005 [Steroidobacteraceae bacterium]